MLTENNKGLGRVMWEKKSGFAVQLHNPGDSDHVKSLKEMIGNMLQATATNRLSASDVLAKMAKLRPLVCGKEELSAAGYGLAKAMCSVSVAVHK